MSKGRPNTPSKSLIRALQLGNYALENDSSGVWLEWRPGSAPWVANSDTLFASLFKPFSPFNNIPQGEDHERHFVREYTFLRNWHGISGTGDKRVGKIDGAFHEGGFLETPEAVELCSDWLEGDKLPPEQFVPLGELREVHTQTMNGYVDTLRDIFNSVDLALRVLVAEASKQAHTEDLRIDFVSTWSACVSGGSIRWVADYGASSPTELILPGVSDDLLEAQLKRVCSLVHRRDEVLAKAYNLAALLNAIERLLQSVIHPIESQTLDSLRCYNFMRTNWPPTCETSFEDALLFDRIVSHYLDKKITLKKAHVMANDHFVEQGKSEIPLARYHKDQVRKKRLTEAWQKLK